MKIDKKRFLESTSYLAEINKQDLETLDFSEFFVGDISSDIEKFSWTGLSNADFVTASSASWDRKYKKGGEI